MALPLGGDEQDAEQEDAELMLLWLTGCAKQGVHAAGEKVSDNSVVGLLLTHSTADTAAPDTQHC